MLVDDGTGPAGKAGAIPKKTFIRVLARFSAGAPIEPKIRGMFDMFRNAGGGGGASLGDDRLSRSGVTSLMNALYSQESETMIEVMVTGLMQGVGVRAALRTVSLTVLDSTAGLTTGHSPQTTENGQRVITYDNFREACEGLDEVDTLLTLTFPVSGSG